MLINEKLLINENIDLIDHFAQINTIAIRCSSHIPKLRVGQYALQDWYLIMKVVPETQQRNVVDRNHIAITGVVSLSQIGDSNAAFVI